jgi:DNA ligase-1
MSRGAPYLPMQAHPVELDAVGTRCDGYLMEPKLDGWRCIAQREGRRVTLWTRSGKEMTAKLPHIVAELEAWNSDYDFVLDGELGYIANEDTWWLDSSTPRWPIIDFNATTRVLGSDPPVARAKQYPKLPPSALDIDESWHGIHFFVFDVLRFQTELIQGKQSLRWDELNRFFNQRPSGVFRDGLTFVLRLRPQQWNEERYTDYVLAGGEGVMLKNPNADYTPGKRLANRWYKVKAFETIDVVIIDQAEWFLPGQGKYEGQVGAVYFGYHDSRGAFVPAGKCSGMDDATRLHMTNHPEEYRGKVMEIKYFGKVGADMSGLRHPNFLRMRPDKQPEECVL